MSEDREHPYIPKLKQQFAEGRCSRREFLRTSTLLGVSAAAAYTFVGKVTGEPYVKAARAEMPKGGNLRIGMDVQELTTPHAYAWGQSDISRNVVEYAPPEPVRITSPVPLWLRAGKQAMICALGPSSSATMSHGTTAVRLSPMI